MSRCGRVFLAVTGRFVCITVYPLRIFGKRAAGACYNLTVVRAGSTDSFAFAVFRISLITGFVALFRAVTAVSSCTSLFFTFCRADFAAFFAVNAVGFTVLFAPVALFTFLNNAVSAFWGIVFIGRDVFIAVIRISISIAGTCLRIRFFDNYKSVSREVTGRHHNRVTRSSVHDRITRCIRHDRVAC